MLGKRRPLIDHNANIDDSGPEEAPKSLGSNQRTKRVKGAIDDDVLPEAKI